MEQTILIDVIIAGVLTSYFTPDEEERKVLGGEVLGGRGLAETSLYSRRSRTNPIRRLPARILTCSANSERYEHSATAWHMLFSTRAMNSWRKGTMIISESLPTGMV
jgi:hypothetical protein